MQNNSKRIFRRLREEIFWCIYSQVDWQPYSRDSPISRDVCDVIGLNNPCAKEFIEKQNGSLSWWTCVQASLVDCRRCVSPPRLVSLLFLPTSLGTFRFALGLFCYGSERNPDLYRKFWSDEF